jgi:hypothetical protein
MMGGCGADISRSGYKSLVGSCEHGKDPRDPKKGWKFD